MQAKLGMESGRFLTLSSSEKDMKRLKKNAQEQKKLSREGISYASGPFTFAD